jgi:hypothetical protein
MLDCKRTALLPVRNLLVQADKSCVRIRFCSISSFGGTVCGLAGQLAVFLFSSVELAWYFTVDLCSDVAPLACTPATSFQSLASISKCAIRELIQGNKRCPK